MTIDWPEKVAIGAALVIAGAMLLFWAVLADGVGSMHDNRLNIAVLDWFLETELLLILPFWLLLRTIHLVSKSYRRWRSRL